MATCDHPSDLASCVAYPALGRPGLRRLPSSAREKGSWSSDSSSVQAVEVIDLFRESLIASGKSKRRNPWATAGAVALQLVLLAAVIVIPLFHTDPLPKRQTVTMLYLQPPPGAIGAPAKFRAPKPASTYTPPTTRITAPETKIQEAPPPPVGATGGIVGGVPGGVIGGLPGGVVSQMLNGTTSVPVPAPAPAPVKRMRIASRVAEANLIHDVAPTYPAEAGRERIEGTVVLMALIGPDGRVKDIRVESGLPVLAQAAVEAVKQWRYKPYLVDGAPVEVDSRITINFTLSRG
jgi:protein TonB